MALASDIGASIAGDRNGAPRLSSQDRSGLLLWVGRSHPHHSQQSPQRAESPALGLLGLGVSVLRHLRPERRLARVRRLELPLERLVSR